MSFVKKAVPPPHCEEGDVLPAKIAGVKKVTSQWKDDEGNPKEQLEFDLVLDNGYRARAWIAYYEQPSDRSTLGKLALKLGQAIGKEFQNIDEFLTSLKQLEYIFVKVKSFRENEGEMYPNFGIVTEKLPASQEKLEKVVNPLKPEMETRQYNAKTLLAQFADAISFGIPLNEQDWSKSLLVGERLFLLKQNFVEHKDGLYFFTTKANELFPKASL